jgi:hypothetical protein
MLPVLSTVTNHPLARHPPGARRHNNNDPQIFLTIFTSKITPVASLAAPDPF